MSNGVAVITDIHANRPALDATMGRIAELGIEAIYCGGDLVGYGSHPNEVCRLIEERGIPTIYGNYDYAIGRDLHDCGCAYRDPHERVRGESVTRSNTACVRLSRRSLTQSGLTRPRTISGSNGSCPR